MKKSLVAWMLVISLVASVIPQSVYALAAETGMVDYESMEMSEILNREESLTWVFAGDSITHNPSFTQGMNGYAEWFEQYLYDIDRSKDTVVNAAISGADIRDFLYASDTPSGQGTSEHAGKGLEGMITKYNPDVVFIKIGMNNQGLSNADFITYYNKMLDGIIAEGAKNNKVPKIVILTPTPTSGENLLDDMADPNPEQVRNGNMLRYRNMLEKIAKERGFLFCDLRTAFLKEAESMGAGYLQMFFSDPSDGVVHPNTQGQYLMFKTLSKTLGIYDESMPIFQIEYEDIRYAALYEENTSMTYTGYSSNTADAWKATIATDNIWTVVGGEQMFGYDGTQVHRSVFRLIDNVIRRRTLTCNIRMLNAAFMDSEGNVANDLLADYDATVTEHNSDVLMILPEVTEVYKTGYVHTEQKVAQYKADLEAIIAKDANVIKVLWSPLASENSTINSYINDYAKAVREIAAANANVLFFDANQFMNDHMLANWFESDMYISPLCAVDLAKAFFASSSNFGWGTNTSYIYTEQIDWYTLRKGTDKRIFKGDYVRDYVEAAASVSGEQITIDISDITDKYPNLINVEFYVLPFAGAGNYHKDLYYIEDVTKNGDQYTFEAPCKNPMIAIYGENGDTTYRFKDKKVSVSTSATIDNTPSPSGVYLDYLAVAGAAPIAFTSNTTTYDVNLYAYQNYVQVYAEAQDGLTIQVGDDVVESGFYSPFKKVKDGDKITVKVSNNETEKTYTLNLKKAEYPDIIVTEVMVDGYNNATAGVDDYDLIEIYNASGKDLDLKDYSIGHKIDSDYANRANSDYISYYFVGNNQVFQTKGSSGAPTYTGINQITKYSSYWSGSSSEPASIPFPANSTMVLWVKYGNAEATYDTLITALKAGTYTKNVNGTTVVPAKDQLVVAEVPSDVKTPTLSLSNSTLAEDASQNFYLYDANQMGQNFSRNWLFILKNTAKMAENGAITEAGNDIISAAKQEQVAATEKLSSVFYYNLERGMSILRSESANGNLTTFGAIEYWQKPVNTEDTTAPVVKNNTSPVATKGSAANIKLSVSDDTEVRAIELFVRKSGESTYTKVMKDYVLESCVANSGVAKAQKNAEYVYSLGTFSNMVEYYGTVSDGKNVTSFGSAENPLTIVRGAVKEYDDISTTPELDGFLFAGWYTEENCMTPLDKVNAEGSAWAKFVAEDILTVKAQVSNGTLSNGKYVIRFISSVDSLKYQSVGFEVSYDDNGTKKTVSSNATTVYERIDSNLKGAEYEFSPKVVDTQSEYFVTAKLAVSTENVSKDYTVRAYWVTLDGTKVYGPSRCVAVVDGQDDTALNMSFKNTSNAEVGTTIKAEYNATSATATVIGVDDSTVHVRINVDKTTLKSATLFTFKSTDGSTTYGSEVYRNLYTSYTGTADTSWYDVYNALGETEFIIATNADLYGIASIAKATDDFAGKTIYVVSDIEANDGDVILAADKKSATWSGNTSYMWAPIGVNNSHPFVGTFDGQGHTISGIYYNKNVVVGGMFTHIAPGGVAKNFRLVNSYISTQSTGYTGSIAGKCAGVIESVYSNAFVRGTVNVGGLVGEAGYISGDSDYVMSIRNSWFDGAVYATSNATGGITGFLYKVANKYGSTPDMVKAEITDCLMSGTVNSTGTYVGGIIGDTQHGDGNFTLNVDSCLVTGTVATTGALKGAIWGRVASGVCSIVDSYAVSECGVSALVGSGTVTGNSADRFVAKANITGLKADEHVVMERLGKEKWTATSSTPELIQFVKNAVDVDWYYDNPNATEFVISTAEELYGLGIVSQSTNFAGKIIKLADDIVLNEGDASKWKLGAVGGLRQWNSIGSNDAATQFAGTFDGQGHTISGLYGQYSTICNGLFATVCSTGLVTNLRLENSFLTSSNGYLGSIAGRSYGGTFTKIYSNAHVVGTGLLKPDGVNVAYNTGYIGGIVGVSIGVTDGKEDVLFSQCWFDGTVNSTTGRNGGIVGAIHSYPYSTELMIVEDCLFTGSIATTVVRHTVGVGTAGIVGATCSASDTLKFKNCVAVDDAKILVNTGHFLGAILGATYTYSSTGISLDNCYVIGNSVPPVGIAAHSAFTGTVTGSATVVDALSGAAAIANTSDNWTLIDGVPTLKVFAE